MNIEREMNRQIDIFKIYTDRQTERQIYRQIYIYIQIARDIDIQMERIIERERESEKVRYEKIKKGEQNQQYKD